MIHLELQRFSSGEKSTLGLLYQDSAFVCFTLEDEYRTQKVYAETRIPAGQYAMELRAVGGMHSRYLLKFGDWHRGMLWLRDVPDFEYVYFHIGNDDEDSAGCILVGDGATQNITERGSLIRSTAAYKRFYGPLAAALYEGQAVTLKIHDET